MYSFKDCAFNTSSQCFYKNIKSIEDKKINKSNYLTHSAVSLNYPNRINTSQTNKKNNNGLYQ